MVYEANNENVITDKILNDFINLYNHIPKITDLDPIRSDEYVLFSLKNTGFPVGILDAKNTALFEYIPHFPSLQSFLFSSPITWVIPLETAFGDVFGFIYRSYDGKNYRNYVKTDNIVTCYGWLEFNTFRQNYPIVLTEGIKDALVIKQIYPYTLSLLTAGMTSTMLKIIRTFTDKVILCYDSDKAGHGATTRDIKSLIDVGAKVKSVKYLAKDPGDLYKNKIAMNALSINLDEIIKQM
jgi:hypothetical protein